MDYRMLELMAPPETIMEAREIVKQEEPLGVWTDNLDDSCSILRVLVNTDRTESLSDQLTEKFSNVDGFRIMLFSVEATLPQPEVEEEKEPDEEEPERNIGRISREELYADVTSGSELNWVYVGMVVLSTVVAGVGLIRDDVAVIIGAMVIAPLLGPNVSMALAATLGDLELGWRSLKANAAGLFASLAVALLMGLLIQVDLDSQQLINKTNVGLGDIAIALAAGSAGVLAFTRGVPATIVGVMVAVALLPPLVNVGLLLGSGYTGLAVGSIILTLTNLICINLAGILTFLFQGVRPRTWWEAKKAQKNVRIAIAVWFVLLMVLSIIIWYWNLVSDTLLGNVLN
ncbi:TIGR00341 family protein [Aliifodinibius sp. S!AR15-10]|uniref:TIGR00341 family protein n=1 Tax=Aliifodinibius sp. S!AR15-10 TaxID=2950437 RepID=UPI0028582D4A|nr:TIGR00341 family protein [Aliifodinibius sp. S!AR15-10]MDR8391778.1 TIGR00341 family protein [Aliifodinibius sp. S!AR15-10]